MNYLTGDAIVLFISGALFFLFDLFLTFVYLSDYGKTCLGYFVTKIFFNPNYGGTLVGLIFVIYGVPRFRLSCRTQRNVDPSITFRRVGQT